MTSAETWNKPVELWNMEEKKSICWFEGFYHRLKCQSTDSQKIQDQLNCRYVIKDCSLLSTEEGVKLLCSRVERQQIRWGAALSRVAHKNKNLAAELFLYQGGDVWRPKSVSSLVCVFASFFLKSATWFCWGWALVCSQLSFPPVMNWTCFVTLQFVHQDVMFAFAVSVKPQMRPSWTFVPNASHHVHAPESAH